MKRNLTLLSALVALCLTVFAPMVACAQSDDASDLSKDWTIRLGAFIANNKQTRSKIGSIAIAGFADRTVFDGEQYKLTVGIGYLGDDTFYSIPIILNVVFKHDRLYYGGGVGYGFAKRLDGRSIGAISMDALIGTQLTKGKNAMTAELRYNFTGGSENEMDGFSLTLGIHL